MIKQFLYLPLFIALFSACTSSVVIDNPLETNINVTIDGKTYDLIAYEQLELDMKNTATHVITTDAAGEELLNETIDISGDGVLNATKSTYVIWRDLYCLPADYEKYIGMLNLKELIAVNGKEYEEVDFTLTEASFIPKTWDYNLNEIFPDSVDISNKYSIKSKIYRPGNLEEEFGYFGGDIDFSDYDDADVNAFIDSLTKVLDLESEE